MSRLLAGLRGYVADARTALRFAPVEVALGWLIAFSASWAIAVQNADVLETWTRLGVSVAIALPIVFGASILRAASAISSRTRWLVTVAALAVGAAYGALVFRPVSSEAWRAWLLVGASVAALMLTPVLMRREAAAAAAPPWNAISGERSRFWIFFQRVAARFITVYGLAILLAAGLSIAIAAVDSLFNLNATDEETYLHVFSFIVIGIGTWAMAGAAAELAAPVEVDREIALLRARRVGLYLLLPLLLVYTAILYAYMIRMAVLGEVPQNLVSPLVLAAGGMWLAGAVVLEPFHWLEDSPIAARVIRFYPWLALPLVALGVWALWIRVEQYSWTEFRYVRFAALAGLASLAVTGIARRLTSRPPILREIPFTLALLMLVAATGPWGAPATALRSQRARLSRLGAAAEAATPPGRASTRVAVEAETEAAAVVRYVRDHFGEDRLEGAVSPELVARLDSLNLLWGGRSAPAEGPARVLVYATMDDSGGVRVPAGTLRRFSFHEGQRGGMQPTGPYVFSEGLMLKIRMPNRALSADLADLAAVAREQARSNGFGAQPLPERPASFGARLDADQRVVPVSDERDGADAGVLVLDQLTLEFPPDGSVEGATVQSAGGFLVVGASPP